MYGEVYCDVLCDGSVTVMLQMWNRVLAASGKKTVNSWRQAVSKYLTASFKKFNMEKWAQPLGERACSSDDKATAMGL